MSLVITAAIWILICGLIAQVLRFIHARSALPPQAWFIGLAMSLLIFMPIPINAISVDIPWIDATDFASVSQVTSVAVQRSVSGFSVSLFLNIITAVLVLYTGYRIYTSMRNAQRLRALVRAGIPIEKSQLPYPIFITPIAASPFVIGVMDPTIALPEYFLHLSRKEKRIVLAHEFSHLRARDHIAVYIWRLLVESLWLNPFIRMFEQGFVQSIEYRCDSNTLKRHRFSSYLYAKTLLRCLRLGQKNQTATPLSNLAVCFSIPSLSVDDFKQRLAYIEGNSERNKQPLRLGMAMFALMITIAATNNALAFLQTSVSWVYPVASPVISSDFKTESKIRNYRPHKGLDFIGIVGTPVYASAGGKVLLAKDNTLPTAYGQSIVIQHQHEWQSLYAHLSEIFVESGQTVQQGELIGLIGATGRVTGPHLHFELAHKQTVVDPKYYLAPLTEHQNAIR